MAYYDPTTWNAVDPTKVTSYTNGYDEWNNPITGYRDATGKTVNQASGTGVNGWGDWLAGEGATANARSYNRLQNYMGDLSTKYGLGANDFIKGFQAYGAQYNPGATDEYGNVHGFGRDPNMGWWGEDAMIRALGQGLDKANPDAAYKGSWQDLWNQQRELGQQNEIANIWQQNQDRMSKANDFIGTDLPTILGGLGLVAGAGALGGAFGGSGLFGGADVVGSDWASGLGSAMNPGSAGAIGNVGGFDAGNWVSPSIGGEGGAAVDPGGATFTGTPSSAGGNMDWLDELLNQTGTGTGTVTNGDPLAGLFNNTGVGTPGGQVTGDTGSDWSTGGSNPGSGSVYGPGASGGSTMPNLPPGASSALSRILSGNGTAADYASLAGTAGTGFLSYLSANKYTDAMKQLADRSWNAGQPYRDKLAASYADPNAFLANSPDIQASVNQGTNALARSLSTQGNPIGNGRALQEMQNYATNGLYGQLGNARQQLANFGGQSAISGAFPQLGSQSADSSGNVYNSLANTTTRLTQPDTDWTRLFQSFGFAPNVKPPV